MTGLIITRVLGEGMVKGKCQVRLPRSLGTSFQGSSFSLPGCRQTLSFGSPDRSLLNRLKARVFYKTTLFILLVPSVSFQTKRSFQTLYCFLTGSSTVNVFERRSSPTRPLLTHPSTTEALDNRPVTATLTKI